MLDSVCEPGSSEDLTAVLLVVVALALTASLTVCCSPLSLLLVDVLTVCCVLPAILSAGCFWVAPIAFSFPLPNRRIARPPLS